MSTYSRITDDEMKYFQFKARQQFMIKKDDHEWNEFCKKTRCTCCSCQPLAISKPLKDVGIQVVAKKPNRFNQNRNVKTLQGKEFPDSLMDIKNKLKELSLSVSEIKQIQRRDKTQSQASSNEDKLRNIDSAFNAFTEQKKSILKDNLISSIQRLHSFALQRSPRPISIPKVVNKSRSFFLPHDLEKQRIIARRAYLASLTNKPKIMSNKEVSSNVAKKTKISKTDDKRIPLHATFKSRKKKLAEVKTEKTEQTLIQKETVAEEKDENIETVVDGILDDLLGEEILSLNRIRLRKKENRNKNFSKLENEAVARNDCFEIKFQRKEVDLNQESPTVSKVKLNQFFNLQKHTEKIDSPRYFENSSPPTNLEIRKETTIDHGIEHQEKHQSITNTEVNFGIPSTGEARPQVKYKVLKLDPELGKNIIRQRKLYMQYLEKISRTRTQNFDPWALSNMVAESLLDDCIADVCQELGDVPVSLITDLYNQEFAPLL